MMADLAGIKVAFTPSWPPIEYKRRVAEAISAYLTANGEMSLPNGDGPIGELEWKYKAAVGRDYALATNSGTSALHSAFFALGVAKGDEVLAAVTSFHASVTPLIHFGATPVLCEVDSGTGEIDLEDAAKRVTERTRGLVVTHMYGYPADMHAVRDFAAQRGLWVVEDCSHAHGATFNGQQVGSFGDIAVFSLQQNKLAPAGEGGILLSNSAVLYERAAALGHFGSRLERLTDPSLRSIAATGFGLKYRMHPLAAVAGLVGLEMAPTYTSMRRQYAERLAGALGNAKVRSLTFRFDPGAVYFLFRATYVANGIDIDDYLKRASELGVPIHRASQPPLHVLPLFQSSSTDFAGTLPESWLRYRNGEFPQTEAYCRSLISLPSFWAADQQGKVDELASRLGELEREYV